MMRKKNMFHAALVVGLGVAAFFCGMLVGCSRLKHVEPDEFKKQVELRDAQTMFWGEYIGQADGRAFLLRKRMPLIGKAWKEEVLYTETSRLGEDFLKELERIGSKNAAVPGRGRRAAR